MRARIAILLLFVILTAEGCFDNDSENENAQVAEVSPKAKGAGTAFCQLAGNVRDTKKTSSTEAFGGLIRVRFVSNGIESCRERVIEYCRSRLVEGYVPENLILTFRQQVNSEQNEKFSVSARCTIEPVNN